MFVASDSIRRAFGIWRKYSLSADSCCPFSDYGWGHNKQRQARCFSCYSQLFASISGKLLNVHVVDRGGHELSDSIFYLCPHITRNSTTQPDELLGHWSCCDSTCTKKFGTIYQVRRGIQAMLTIWICHFVRLSRRFRSKMAPTKGDTALRSLIFSLFLSFLFRHLAGLQTYSREELLLLRNSCVNTNSDLYSRQFLFENSIVDSSQAGHDSTSSSQHSQRQGRRRRGKRGGVLARLRRRNTKVPLPSIMLANVRSLRYKMDELIGLMDARQDFRDCSAYFITETWLDSSVPDSAVKPPGFALFRSDRICENVNKQGGGGVCFLVNEAWCTDSKILSQTCTPELETLTIIAAYSTCQGSSV